jgi:hypothetical protein
VGKYERKMIDLCTARPAIDPLSWTVAPILQGDSQGLASSVSAASTTKTQQQEKKDGGPLTNATNNALSSSVVAAVAVAGVSPSKSKMEADVFERFRADLDNFSYHLPPHFDSFKQWYTLIPQKTRLEFEMVVLRFNIMVDVIKGTWENIAKAEK